MSNYKHLSKIYILVRVNYIEFQQYKSILETYFPVKLRFYHKKPYTNNLFIELLLSYFIELCLFGAHVRGGTRSEPSL